MSRIGKEPVKLADGVTATVAGQKVTVKGKLGELSYTMHDGITAKAVPAITEMKRISKPGLRRFVSVPEIPAVLDGMGLAILSTSKGVMSGAEAKKAKVGGEIICTVA